METILFEDYAVLISNHRFVIKETNSTYFTKNISSAQININNPSILFIIVGIFFILLFKTVILPIIGIYFIYRYFTTNSYTLIIQNNAGSINAITSKDYKYLTEIQDFLIKSINRWILLDFNWELKV